MELREWLIILGLVLVAIILVDGVRRLQRQRRGLRMDLSRDIDARQPAQDQSDIERGERVSWELPNGGARVVSHGDDDPDDVARADAFDASFDDERLDHDPGDERERGHRSTHDQDPDFLDMPSHDDRDAFGDEDAFDDEDGEPVPRRRDAFARRLKAAFPGSGARKREVRLDATQPEDRTAEPARNMRSEHDPLFTDERMRASAADDRERHTRAGEQDWRDNAPSHDDVDYHGEPGHDDEYGRYDASAHDNESAYDEAPASFYAEPRHPVIERAARGIVDGNTARTVLADAEEVVVISVMSRDEGFHGPDLLQLVLACGLRLDDRGVFHRFETESSQSPLQFSMVNVVKPGTFDLDVMEEDATPGVTFLMPMPGAESAREAFEAMFETARVLVRNLGGELKDENRSVMTAQTVEFARQRVHEFERRWRLHRHQAN